MGKQFCLTLNEMSDAAKVKIAMREIAFRYSTQTSLTGYSVTPLLEPIEMKLLKKPPPDPPAAPTQSDQQSAPPLQQTQQIKSRGENPLTTQKKAFLYANNFNELTTTTTTSLPLNQSQWTFIDVRQPQLFLKNKKSTEYQNPISLNRADEAQRAPTASDNGGRSSQAGSGLIKPRKLKNRRIIQNNERVISANVLRSISQGPIFTI